VAARRVSDWGPEKGNLTVTHCTRRKAFDEQDESTAVKIGDGPSRVEKEQLEKGARQEFETTGEPLGRYTAMQSMSIQGPQKDSEIQIISWRRLEAA
jgi:hypothetical protein